MKNKFICLFLLVVYASFSNLYGIDKIGVLTQQSVVISFPAPIIDVRISNSISNVATKEKDYIIDRLGTEDHPASDVSLRAIRASASKSTLYVRYGTLEKSVTYVAEIYPDENAPVHLIVGSKNSIQDPKKNEEEVFSGELNQTMLFSPNEKQQYNWFAIKEGGITVMVTNIVHSEKNTYLRVFVENATTVNLKLSHCSFEYITNIRKWWFFTTEQKNPVAPLIQRPTLEVGPLKFDYFDFSIPTYTSNGGLDITLAESEHGARKYTINIPSKILLQAPRK